MGAAIRSVGVVVLALVFGCPAAARAQSAVERYRALLAPHGTWVSTAPLGDVFVPREASDEGFAPYLSEGRWSATDRGLAFESTYAWGAVCFHHGRWARLDGRDTWAWVPGEAWSSAWVEWRRRGSDVAWRPMAPPEGRSGAARWYVVALGSLGAADLASRVLRVGDDSVAGFAAIGEMSLDGGRAEPRAVPRGQVMLSGGGRIVVHERGRDRVLEVDPVVVPRGSAEEREALRRAELAREREAERAREREAAAARLAAAPAPPATATATVVVAPSSPSPSTPTATGVGTAWTLGYGYGPYGYGFGAPGYPYGGPGYPYGAAGYAPTAPASATPPRDGYSPPRFGAPRLPFGGWRE